MIHIILGSIDVTTPNTIRKSLNTIENDVNAFVKNSSVKIVKTDVFDLDFGGLFYLGIVVEYDQKPQ